MSNFNTDEIVLFPYYVEGSAPLFRVGFDSFSGFAPRGWETDKNKAIALAQAFNEAYERGRQSFNSSTQPPAPPAVNS